jgi:transposase
MPVRVRSLIHSLAGTTKIIAEGISVENETNALVVKARPTKREQCRCGICHKRAAGYDSGRETRRWRCLDIGAEMTYIESSLPRVRCKEHGVVSAAVPWARHKSRFCKNFEETVAWLSPHASKKAVSELMRIEWHTVGNICKRIYKELEQAAPKRFDGLVNIGIDETSYKKGHKYMTVVINHDTAAVVWCGIGYGKEVLSGFFELLTLEQRASIRCVSADGARWIASCIDEYCPNAERCVDPFHVVTWATEALDKERRQAWSEAYQAVKEAKKRGRGHPAKGENVNPEKKQAKAMKNLRYVLLKNPENLSENQQTQLKFLTQANPRLYRAYLLKEGLRLALKAGADEIEYALNKWMAWAQRCRIPGFRELRLKIKRNFVAIVASAKHGLSNARMEATNNKIKLGIRTAFGFRNPDSLIAMVMLTCSDVQPRLPGR